MRDLLPLNGVPLGCFWTYDDPDLDLCFSFGSNMDTTKIPPLNKFSIDVDGVGKTPDAANWLNSRVLHFDYAEALLSPTLCRLIYPTWHINLHTILGGPTFPFNILGFEEETTATAGYFDPDLEIVVTFGNNMDTSKVPNPSDFIIYANDVPKTPDSIQWNSVTDLEILYAEVGLGVGPFDIELPDPVPRCVNPSQVQACPFRLDDLPGP